jgi:uncharacterized BrkB/YihY/UPF0761 family membrane protein
MARFRKRGHAVNRQFAISVVVLFVLSMALGFAVHGAMLSEEYAKLVPNVFRTPKDSEAHFIYMILAHVLMAFGLTWIYRQGRDNRPWPGQGARFGLAVAVLMTIPNYLIYYAVQPLPGELVVKQIVFDTIAVVIMGIATAALNRLPTGQP